LIDFQAASDFHYRAHLHKLVSSFTLQLVTRNLPLDILQDPYLRRAVALDAIPSLKAGSTGGLTSFL